LLVAKPKWLGSSSFAFMLLTIPSSSSLQDTCSEVFLGSEKFKHGCFRRRSVSEEVLLGGINIHDLAWPVGLVIPTFGENKYHYCTLGDT
jgi:hypothetical protein